MRIVNIYGRFKTMSGGPVHIFNLAEHVIKNGHEFRILTSTISDRCAPYVPKGASVISPRWMSKRFGIQLIDSFLDVLFAGLLGFYVPKDADCFVVHSDAAILCLFVYKFIRRGKLPTLYYCYQPTQFAYNLTKEKARVYALGFLLPVIAPFYRVIDKFSANQADTIAAFSTAYRQKCLDLYKVRDVFLVPPGVDKSKVGTSDPNRIWKKHSLSPDTRAIITVNKLVVQKNVDILIRAMVHVVKELPKARAFIVGDGPEYEKLQKLAKDLGLEQNVIFSGFVQEWSEVCDYYAASSALVFLEPDVPFGMTPVEAGGFEKPTIAVASGGSFDTIDDGKTGYLVSEPLDEHEIADKIKILLADKKLCDTLGRAAKIKSEQFSWQRCAEEYVEALEKTIEIVNNSKS